MDYADYLKPINQGTKLSVLPVKIINEHSKYGPVVIGRAAHRLASALARSGFEHVAPGVGGADVTIKLAYTDSYATSYAEYEASVDAVDAVGKTVLSEKTSSFPGKDEGHEIYDWLPILPLQLTAVLTNNAEPLIYGMWGRFRDGASASAMALKHFPTTDVVRNLLEISRKQIRLVLKFGPDSASFVYLTEAGTHTLKAAEYYAVAPHAATQENAFHSLLHIVGNSDTEAAAVQISRDGEWVADHLQPMIHILSAQIYGAVHRRGAVSVLSRVSNEAAIDALKESAKKDSDVSVRQVAAQAVR